MKSNKPSVKKTPNSKYFIKKHNLVKESQQMVSFSYKRSLPGEKKVTNMTIFLIKSHNLVKKVTNMTIFVIKSHYLVNKFI